MEKFDFKTIEGRQAYYKEYNRRRKEEEANREIENHNVSYDEACRTYYKRNYHTIKAYVREHYQRNRDTMIAKTTAQRSRDRWKYKAYQALYYQRHKNEYRDKRIALRREIDNTLKSTTLKLYDDIIVHQDVKPLAIFTAKKFLVQIESPIQVKFNVAVHFD